jgi:hypothetical protein
LPSPNQCEKSRQSSRPWDLVYRASSFPPNQRGPAHPRRIVRPPIGHDVDSPGAALRADEAPAGAGASLESRQSSQCFIKADLVGELQDSVGKIILPVMRLKLFLVVAVIGVLLRGAAFFSGVYINSDGEFVQSPRFADHILPGAVAICGDGAQSFSRHTWGTCNQHGGVARWL